VIVPSTGQPRSAAVIAASVSDPDHGRKVDADQAKDRALTGSEVGWLQAAGKLLIRRVLEHEAGVANLPLLTMNDLPAL
jgi:hypothetical protein